MTFGNTKAIDLIVERESRLIPIQVKGIQRTKSICWNISRSSVQDHVMYVFVNLNADTYGAPEFFILTGAEVKTHLKDTKSGRDYIDHSVMKRLSCQDKWDKLL